jgi:hypothetical protein
MKQQSNQPSGVMKAASTAATKVSNWSSSKQSFARRVTTTGSFKSSEPASLKTTAAGSFDQKKNLT